MNGDWRLGMSKLIFGLLLIGSLSSFASDGEAGGGGGTIFDEFELDFYPQGQSDVFAEDIYRTGEAGGGGGTRS